MDPDDRIVTGEAVALELRLAGAGSRGIAALIDLVLMAALEIGLIIGLVVIGGDISPDTLITLLIVTEVGVLLGYPILMETLWRGRTLGKAIMGLRVVRDDGGPIRFRHALVRGLVGLFVDKPGVTYSLAAFIPIVASRRKKRFGDYFAGTIVLQERVPSRIEVSVQMPAPLAGWAAALDLSAIDDGLALRLRQFVGRAGQLTSQARATLERQLASDVVARVGSPPADAPGWAVINAVLAERRRRAFLVSPGANATSGHAWAAASPPGTTSPAWPATVPPPSTAAAPAPPTTAFAMAPPYLAADSVDLADGAGAAYRSPQPKEPHGDSAGATTATAPSPPPASTTGFVLPG